MGLLLSWKECKQSTGDIPKFWKKALLPSKSPHVLASPEWPASQLQSQILHLLLHWDKEVLGLNSRLFTRKQGVVVAWSPGGLWLLPASVGNPSLSMAWTSSTRESEHRKNPR